jgi:hypothetical protein
MRVHERDVRDDEWEVCEMQEKRDADKGRMQVHLQLLQE